MQETNSGDGTSVTNMVSAVEWSEATNPPAYEAEGLNGLPCLVGNGTDARIISTEAEVLAAFSGSHMPFTVIMVVEPTVAVANESILGVASSGSTSSSFRFGKRTLSPGRWCMEKRGNAPAATLEGLRGVVLQPVVVSFWTNGESGSIGLNLADEQPRDRFVETAIPAPNRCALFCRPQSSLTEFSTSKAGCWLVFSRELPRSERLGIVAALMGRWGISS
jgi:hypothetical protein